MKTSTWKAVLDYVNPDLWQMALERMAIYLKQGLALLSHSKPMTPCLQGSWRQPGSSW